MSVTLSLADSSVHATPDKVCVLCGEPFLEFGNNPWPLATLDDGECCDNCNHGRVLPARFARLAKA